MIINESILKKILKNRENATTIYMNNNSINKLTFKFEFYNIEFLSLQNNSISDLKFIKFFPNIWYLDLRNNPIDNYEPLNSINCLGFLGLSVEKYHEKKVLVLRKLYLGIIELNFDDYNKKLFLSNNPNIIKFNEELQYYHEKINQINFNSYNIMTTPGKMAHMSNSKNFTSNFKLDILSINSKFLLDFFQNFNVEINSIKSSHEELFNDKIYLLEERKKIITLFKIFESLNKLNRVDDKLIKLTKNIIGINAENFKDTNFENSEMYDNPFNTRILDIDLLIKMKDGLSQSMILCVLILNVLSILGTDFCINLLKFLLKNNKIEIDENSIKNLLEIDKKYLLGLFYDLYDNYSGQILKKENHPISCFSLPIDCLEKSNLNVKNIPNNILPQKSLKSQQTDFEKYQDVTKSLEMSNLILKANHLNSLYQESTKIYNLKNDFQSRKTQINNNIINILENFNIFNEILILMQFVNDYILLHKLNLKMVKENTFQFRVFIEIKEAMFTHLNKKEDIQGNNLIDKRYIEMKYKRFGNKLYFLKNPFNSETEKRLTETQYVNGVTILSILN